MSKNKEEIHVEGREGFKFLIGKKIVKVNTTEIPYGVNSYELICEDGTVITVKTNEGCAGCENGWSSIEDLKILETVDNAIMDIKVECNESPYFNQDDSFKLFIYYHRQMLEVKGDDGHGNGYYGGGFYVTIEKGEKL